MIGDDRQLLLQRKTQLYNALRSAVHSLDRIDWYLLQSDLKEEAINHRLAVYLEDTLNSDPFLRRFQFSIDCEYDKFGLDKKSVSNTWDEELPDRPRDRRIRPDIIVHQRGNDPACLNLMTVEVKKSSTVSNRVKRYALWKSEAYLSSNLAYLFAAYICLNTGVHWKSGGGLRELKLFSTS